MDDLTAAERIVRRFARDTNLLVAGRAFRIRRAGRRDDLADAVERILRGCGAHFLDPADPREDVVEIVLDGILDTGTRHPLADDVPILLDGAPLPDRGDASGRIDAAGLRMPVSRRIAAALDLAGLRIGVAMVLEPKTAQLALLLASRGADVVVYAHPDETDPEVARALAARGIAVDADATRHGAAERRAAIGFLERGMDVLLDDGSHLIRLAHEAVPGVVDTWIGANEETTSGVAPLRTMAARGLLRTGVVAVNDARMKTLFDNRYGTGQSCVFAIADLLDPLGLTVRDQPALVIGYGPVGVGVAAHLRALGAEVRVAETDPVRALVAVCDGFDVGPAADLASGALVVSATGAPHTVTRGLLAVARIAAVAGGVPDELDLAVAAAAGAGLERVPGARGVSRLVGHDTLVLADGGGVNIIGAEGNPIEIMDLSFAVQLAALGVLLRDRPGPGIHEVPAEVDRLVAEAALAARGIRIDERGSAQRAAVDDWRSPRFRADAS